METDLEKQMAVNKVEREAKLAQKCSDEIAEVCKKHKCAVSLSMEYTEGGIFPNLKVIFVGDKPIVDKP